MAWRCDTAANVCSSLVQGFSRGFVAVAAGLVLAAAAGAAPVCAGPGAVGTLVAPGLWWIAGASGDSDEHNRGATAHLLAWRHGGRTWALGSGGTPVLGRHAACEWRRLSGAAVQDLVLPWPQAELTLGASAFAGARRWAHADVSTAMRERCPRCVQRMAQRLGPAAVDLGVAPARLPTHRLSGAQGTLGGADWWRLARAQETAVLVWHWPAARAWSAHGLAWGDGPPDLRDADPAVMERSLRALAQRVGPDERVWPQQGAVMDRAGLLAQADYLAALVVAVDAAQRAGALETDAPAPWPGMAPEWAGHLRHGLNWQRVWALREPLNL
jgi:hypothetical protein